MLPKIFGVIFPVLLLAVTLGIGIHNFTSVSFWRASAYQLLTPIIAICLTFLAVQMKNDEREAKHHAEALLEKIQSIVSEEGFFNVSSIDKNNSQNAKNYIQMNNRRLSNYIDSLSAYSKRFHFEDDIKYLKEQFNDYRELVDTYTDLAPLIALQPTLKNYSLKIENKCDQIIVQLYIGIKMSNKRATE